MQPIQSYLGEQFYKSNGDREVGLTRNNPRQHKGVNAACNTPSNGFEQRLVMTIVCHAFWPFSLICEKPLRWARLLRLAFSCARLTLYGYAHAFCGYWHKVPVSSAPPSASCCFATLTFPVFRASAE